MKIMPIIIHVKKEIIFRKILLEFDFIETRAFTEKQEREGERV